MSNDAALDEAQEKALEARQKMLDARPKDTIPPLPDRIVPDRTICLTYFQTAATLYSMAAEAYSRGDVAAGQMVEFSAYQHMLLGQACVAQTR
jgi:hypothetical protein